MIHVRFIWGVIYIVDKVKLNILILELLRIIEHACITEVRNLKSLEGTGVYSVQLLTLFIHFDELDFNEFEKFFILKLKSEIVARFVI